MSAELLGPIASKGDLAAALRGLLIDHERRTGKPVKKSTLAQRVGVSASSVYAYLNGTTLPSVEVLDQLLHVLDAPVADRRELATARDKLELAARHPSVVPRQLPGADRHFVGRADEIRTLDHLLHEPDDDAAVIVAVGGTAGIGKTALVVHWARQVQNRFPDGQLYLNLRGFDAGGPLTADQALQGVLQTLGVPAHAIPGGEESKAALFRSLLAGKRMLLLLDNARSDRQLRPLLPGSPDCVVVITSRATLATMDGARHLDLEVLPGRDALTLLERLAGPERVRQEPGAAARVVRLCARLPLAVRIAGARLAARPDWPIRTLARRLADTQHRLDELAVTDRALRASFAVSHRTLLASDDPTDQAAARMFRLLGAVDWVEMSVPVAAALAGLSRRNARVALERLVDDHLLDSPRPGRFQTHDLLRLYARELAAEDEPERDAALRRALDSYLAAATRASLLLHPIEKRRISPEVTGIDGGGFRMSGRSDATAWADAERANLIAAVRHAADREPGMATRLGSALYRPFDTCGYLHDHISVRRLAAEAASSVGDRQGEAQAREDIGYHCGQVGSATEAISEVRRALAIWRDIGDGIGEESALGILATVYKQQGRLHEAVGCFEQALTVCQDIGYRRGQPHLFTNLGLVYQRMGRFDEAITCQQQALAIDRDLGDRLGEAVALSNLAWAYSGAGRADRAVASHLDSLAIFSEIGHRYGEAEQLWGLGLARHALGEHVEARNCWKESIAMLRAIGAIDAAEAGALLRQDVPDTPEVIQSNI